MRMHLQGGVAVGERLNAGIGDSKAHLDARVGSDVRHVADDARGGDELTAMLVAANADLVVVEAAGGHERGVVCALPGAGWAVARVNLRQARAQLAELMTRRRQFVDTRVAEHDRLEHAGPMAARSIRSVIKRLGKQITALDANMDDHMDRHSSKQRQPLDRVKGEGPVTVLSMTAMPHELRRLTRRKTAKPVGVAPPTTRAIARASAVWGGRAPVRAVLYMAVLVALRHNAMLRNQTWWGAPRHAVPSVST